MKALIDKRFNRICQVEPDTAIFPVAEDLEWVTCPDTCDTTWVYDGANFAAPIDTVEEASLTTAQKLALIRADRNNRLAACDWTQLADAPSTLDRAAWATYRQALRDLPNDASLDLNNPVYPVPPIE